MLPVTSVYAYVKKLYREVKIILKIPTKMSKVYGKSTAMKYRTFMQNTLFNWPLLMHVYMKRQVELLLGEEEIEYQAFSRIVKNFMP